jgi:UDP-N-acetylglucosamine:LPS N-acetylglucosamine transferase
MHHHLSLYILGGFGHIKPAQALTEQFRALDIDSHLYDIFGENGKPNYQSANIYNKISRSKILSPIWNLATRHDLLPASFFQPAHLLELATNKDKVQDIREYAQQHPNLIITATHFTPALIAATALPNHTIFLYVTDIYVHGLWKIKPKNVHYLVPMEETKIVLTRHGIDPKRITISPFPIHHEVTNNQSARFKKRIKRLKSKDPKTIDILIMSGGAGTGQKQMQILIDKLAAPAKSKQARLTFLVSTKSLQSSISEYCKKNCGLTKNQIKVLEYTPHSLYKALNKAEILITKAGGDITFEALAEGIPIYTLKDVGDHERLNRQYLEHIGASKPLFLTGHPWDLIQSDILTEEIILMAKAANAAGKHHRQQQTPKIILSILKNKHEIK